MVDPLTIGVIVVGALSAASYYQQRKMQREAEKQANEMASHQISGHNSNRALYTVYGRALIGTTVIYKRVSRRNIPMANATFTNFVGGGGSPSTESKTYGLNRFLYRISSLSNGPINAIENVLIDGETYTAARFTAGHTKHFESAVSLGPTAGNHFSNLRTSYSTDFSAWGTDKKGQGVAYVVERFWFDKSNPAYQGEPQTQYLVRGRSVYDPRLDSTVSGGSGSHRNNNPATWAFSDNPALALLDMLTNTEYGRGVPYADCNIASFITAANNCDVLVDIPARATNTTGATMVVYDPHTGTTYEIPDNGTISNYRIDQVTTGSNANKQKRFRLNLAVDNSKEVLDNIQQILQSFRANLHHINGEYAVHMDGVASPVITLTDDDIIGGLKISQGDRKQRINRMTVKFLNANKHYKTDQVSWPPLDNSSSSQYQTYLTADSGEKLHKTVTLTGCTDFYQAEDIAEYLVRESRVTLTATGTFGSRCFNLVPGDVIALDYDSAGYSGKYFIVDQVGIDVASMNVKLNLREYDSSVYTWDANRGNEPIGLYFDADQQYNATPSSLTLGTVSSSLVTLSDGTATVSLVVNYSGVPEESTAVEISWAPTGTNDYTTNVMQEDATKTKFSLGIDAQDIDIRARYIVTNADGIQMPSGYVTTTFSLPATSGTRLGGIADNATRNTGVLADRDTVGSSHIENGAVGADQINDAEVVAVLPHDSLAYYWPCNSISDLNGDGDEELQEVVAGRTGVHAGANAPVISTDSPAGRSVQLVGNSGFTLLADGDADALETSSGFAWSFWFKSETTSGGTINRIITRDLSDGWGLSIDQSASGNQAITLYGEPSTEPMGSVAANEWHHFVLSEDGSGTISGYVNGELVGTESYTPVVSARPVVIGSNTEAVINPVSSFFVGKITEIRAYSRALTAQEVRGLYRVPSGTMPAQLDGDLIVDGSVTAFKMNVDTLSSIQANIGAIEGGSLRSSNTNAIPADVFTRSSSRNVPTGSETGTFIDLTQGKFVFGDVGSFVSFAQNPSGSAFELDVKGVLAPTVLDLSAVADETVMPSTMKAQGYVNASIPPTALSDQVWNQIDSLIGQSGTGFYVSATGRYLGEAQKVIALGSTPNHRAGDITVQLIIADSFSADVNFASGSDPLKLNITLQYKLASESDYSNAVTISTTSGGAAGAAQKPATPKQVLSGTVYSINENIVVTLTSGSGQDIADHVDLDFRVLLERVGSQSVFAPVASGGANDTVGTLVELQVSEGAAGNIATSGNANTLDNLDSTQFLRSDTSDTLSGDLTITGNLTVQGTQTTLDTATLQVEDKNITLNYGTGDTSGSANGAGITIQDAVNSSTDATILWNTSSDEFDFSHGLTLANGKNLKITNTGSSNGRLTLANTSSSYDWLAYQDSNGNVVITIIGTGGAEFTFAGDNSNYTNATLSVGGADITATKIGQWNTAYTYSQVGHLPLAGGTLTGTLNFAATTAPLISSQYGDVLWRDAQFNQDLIKQHFESGTGDFLQIRAGGNGSNVDHKFGEGHADIGGFLRISGTTVIDASRNIINVVQVSATNFLSAAGSAASPAYQVGDTDSGFYDSGANEVGVSLSGVLEYEFKQAELNLYNNNLVTTGYVKTGTGTAASPALQVGDDDSGFFDSGANEVGVTLSGVLEYEFTPTQFNMASNNLVTSGTISSGPITATGASAFTDLAVGGAADSNYDLKVYGLARFQGVTNFVNSVQVSGQTILDTSRNLSNIGSISATGPVTIALNSVRHLKVDFDTEGDLRTSLRSVEGSASNLRPIQIEGQEIVLSTAAYNQTASVERVRVSDTGDVVFAADINVSGDLKTGGTTRINSSGNATLGSITSGAITATNISATSLSLSGAFTPSSLTTTGNVSAAQVVASYGSESAPAFTFKNDDDTGMYGSANRIHFAVSGDEKIQVQPSSIILLESTTIQDELKVGTVPQIVFTASRALQNVTSVTSTGNITGVNFSASGSATIGSNLTVSNGELSVTRTGDNFPTIKFARTGGTTKTDQEWLFNIGSTGNLNLRSATYSTYYPIIVTNSGDVNLASNESGGSPVVFIDQSLARTTFAGGVRVNHSEHNGVVVTASDTNADTDFRSMRIDYNVSGSQTLTADRTHSGLNIDVDSSATGGNTSDEHRVYGIEADVRASGDSDIIYGGHFFSRADNFGDGNQVSALRGVNTQAQAHHDAGHVSTTIGVAGQAQNLASGTGSSANNWGVYGLATAQSPSSYSSATYRGVYGLAQAHGNNVANIGSLIGVAAEVQLDNRTLSPITISNAYVVTAIFDENDADDASYTLNNSYLFYGDYQGSNLATNQYGVFIADDVESRFAGRVRAKEFDVGGVKVIDDNRAIQNITGISVTGAVSIAPTNAPAIVANRSNSGSVIDIQSVGVTRGQIGSVGSNLAISSSGTGGYGRLQDNGTDVAIWWTNGIYPATDNAKNLGVSSGSGRWANLFLASGIYMAGSQVLDASRNLLNIGNIATSGNVGIATSSTGSSTKLQVAGRGLFTDGLPDPGDGSPAGVAIGYDTSNAYGFIQAIQTGVANKPLHIQPNGTDHIILGAGGAFVGIGTTSGAQNLLHVNRSDSLASAAQFTNSTTGATSSDGVFLGLGSGEQGYFWNFENNDLIFGTNNIERASINNVGNLNLGPSSFSKVFNTVEAAAQIGRGTITAFSNDFGLGWNHYYSSGWKRLNNDVARRLLFHNTAPLILQYAPTGAANSAITWEEAFRVDGSGNFLVGGSNSIPGAANTVTGISLYNDGRIFASKSGNAVMSLNRNTNDGNLLEFRREGTEVGSIGADGLDMRLGTGITGIIFNNANNAILPYRTNAEDDANISLGLSDFRFKDLHMSGSAFIGTTRLNAGSESAPSHSFYADFDTGMFRATTNQLGFSTAGSERGRYDNAGNLLIGKQSANATVAGVELAGAGIGVFTYAGRPLYLNRLTNDGHVIEIARQGTTVGAVGGYAGDIYIGEGDTALRFNADNDLILPFNSTTGSQATRDAAIDLGTAGGRFRAVYVSNAIRNPAGDLYLISSNNVRSRGANHIWSNAAGSLEYGRFDSSANLLIGTQTSAVQNFSSGSGSQISDGYIAIARGGAVALLNRISTDGDIIEFKKNGSAVGKAGTTGSDLYIGTGDTTIRFSDGGDQIRPATATGANRDAAIDLGKDDTRFKDLHLSGIAYANQIQATNNSGSNGTTTAQYAVIGMASGNQQATIGSQHNGDGYANLNLGSIVSGDRKMWHISKRLNSLSNRLEFFWYESGGFASRFTFSTNGNFTAHNDIQANSIVNAVSGFRVNGTTVIDSGRNLLSIGSISASTLTTSGDITVSGNQVFMSGSNARVKFAVWSNTTYGIGMTNGVTFGGIANNYAMTFQMNNDVGRGFVWLDHDDTLAQGAMALTTDGKLTVANAVRIGFGKTDTTTPESSTAMLNVNGDIQLGSATTNARLYIRKADNDVGDHINIFCGSTQTGQIGSQDTTWLRLNQNINKNIYTPRYIRADNGFRVDGSSMGIMGDGRFRGPDGSISQPSIGFASDTDTGFYRPGADIIGVVAGGGERARFDSNGIELRSGKLLKASRSDNTRDIRLFCDNSFGTLETTADSIRIKSASAIRFDCAGNEHRMNLDTSGNLVVQGNVTAFGSPSDIRLKEGIQRIAAPVSKVQQLDGVTFKYKKTGARSTGLIAQQLLKVLPEVVYQETDLESGEKHYAVRYGQVVGLLVEAIKEQQDQLNLLTEKIEELLNGNYKHN